jgi:hypothetical protein
MNACVASTVLQKAGNVLNHFPQAVMGRNLRLLSHLSPQYFQAQGNFRQFPVTPETDNSKVVGTLCWEIDTFNGLDGTRTPLGRTIIHRAAHLGTLPQIQNVLSLTKAGLGDSAFRAAINEADSHGLTPLMFALYRGIDRNNYPIEASTALLKAGSDVSIFAKDGRSPLLIAAMLGLDGMYTPLFERGASIVDLDRYFFYDCSTLPMGGSSLFRYLQVQALYRKWVNEHS